MDFNEKIVEHIACSHAALDAARQELTKKASLEKQAEEIIPEVVEALIKHERIDPSQREKAAQLLKDPVQALKILIKTADVNNTVRPSKLGNPQDGTEKKSSARNQNYCGFRTSAEKESDRVFLERLLGR